MTPIVDVAGFKKILADWNGSDEGKREAAWADAGTIPLATKAIWIVEVLRDPTVSPENKEVAVRMPNYDSDDKKRDVLAYNPLLQAARHDLPQNLLDMLADTIANLARRSWDYVKLSPTWPQYLSFVDEGSSPTVSPAHLIVLLGIISRLPGYYQIQGQQSEFAMRLIGRCVDHPDPRCGEAALKTLAAVAHEWKDEAAHIDRLTVLLPAIVRLCDVSSSDESPARDCLYHLTSLFLTTGHERLLSPFLELGKQAINDTSMTHRSAHLFLLYWMIRLGWKKLDLGDHLMQLRSDLLSAANTAVNDKSGPELAQLIGEIRSKSGEKKWPEMTEYVSTASRSKLNSARRMAMAILKYDPNMFGPEGEEELENVLRRGLKDPDTNVRSITLAAYSKAVYSMQERRRDTITSLVMELALGDPSTAVGSARACLASLAIEKAFTPILTTMATQKGFARFLPLLVRPLIEGAKENTITVFEDGGTAQLGCPVHRRASCALLLHLAQAFKGDFAAFVPECFALVRLHLEDRDYQHSRDWAVRLLLPLLVSLVASGDIGGATNLFDAYWKLLMGAMSDEVKTSKEGGQRGMIDNMACYVASVASCMEVMGEKALTRDSRATIECFVKDQLENQRRRKIIRRARNAHTWRTWKLVSRVKMTVRNRNMVKTACHSR